MQIIRRKLFKKGVSQALWNSIFLLDDAKNNSIICEFKFFYIPLHAEISKGNMIVTFNEGYLEKLYTDGETGIKKIRFQPQIVRGYPTI